MTRASREILVLSAVGLSVAVHGVAMYLARPQVMTHVALGVARGSRPVAMRVTKPAAAPPEPVLLASVQDRAAADRAPEAAPRQDVAVPVFEAPKSVPDAVAAPTPPVPDAVADLIEPMALDAKPIAVEKATSAFTMPVEPFGTPSVAAPSAPPAAGPRDFAGVEPTVPALTAAGVDPNSLFLPESAVPSLDPERPRRKEAFKPAETVLEKLDEKFVAAEKQAVRDLLDGPREEAPLEAAVDVALARAEAQGWTYFRVTVRPRARLEVVPKDVVILLDGSGSIGNDRFVSCRKAARRILRTCTNSGDRFNLVVFRNRFSYAFRNWRACDAASFAAADRWLSNETAHGRTDVFSTIASVLTLPRDPKRPLVALVVTDGDANEGVSGNADILSRFTRLNDGLVSVYMYGVKSSANRQLIDALTHGNRGESFIFEGWRWNAGDGIEQLSERFRDPVLSDLRVVFTAESRAEAYPRLLRNLTRGGSVDVFGRVPAGVGKVAFSVRGLNGEEAYEGLFELPLAGAKTDPSVVEGWRREQAISEVQ